jgi:hypothetical protein
MIRKILAVILFAPMAITLFLALAGAVAALVGGLAGWENLRTSGGAVAGLGALGFVGWFVMSAMFEFHEILNLFTPNKSNAFAQSNASQSNNAQSNASSLGNNGRST